MKIYYNNRTGCAFICKDRKKKKKKINEFSAVDNSSDCNSIELSEPTWRKGEVQVSTAKNPKFSLLTTRFDCLTDMQLQIYIDDKINNSLVLLWNRIPLKAHNSWDYSNYTDFSSNNYKYYNSPLSINEDHQGQVDWKSGTTSHPECDPFYFCYHDSRNSTTIVDPKSFYKPNYYNNIVPEGTFMNCVGLTCPYMDVYKNNKYGRVIGATFIGYNIKSKLNKDLLHYMETYITLAPKMKVNNLPILPGGEQNELYIKYKSSNFIISPAGIAGLTDSSDVKDVKNLLDVTTPDPVSKPKWTIQYSYDQSFTYLPSRFWKLHAIEILNEISNKNELEVIKKLTNDKLQASVKLTINMDSALADIKTYISDLNPGSGLIQDDPKAGLMIHVTTQNQNLLKKLADKYIDDKGNWCQFRYDKTQINNVILKRIYLNYENPILSNNYNNPWETDSPFIKVVTQNKDGTWPPPPSDNRYLKLAATLVDSVEMSTSIVFESMDSNALLYAVKTSGIIPYVVGCPYFTPYENENNKVVGNSKNDNNIFPNTLNAVGLFWSETKNYDYNKYLPVKCSYTSDSNYQVSGENTYTLNINHYYKTLRLTTIIIPLNTMNNYFISDLGELQTVSYQFITQKFINKGKRQYYIINNQPINNTPTYIPPINNTELIIEQSFNPIPTFKNGNILNFWNMDGQIVDRNEPFMNGNPKKMIGQLTQYKFLILFLYTEYSLYFGIILSNSFKQNFNIEELSNVITGMKVPKGNYDGKFSGNYKRLTDYSDYDYIYTLSDQYKIPFTGINYLADVSKNPSIRRTTEISWQIIQFTFYNAKNDMQTINTKVHLNYNSVSYFYLSLILEKIKKGINNIDWNTDKTDIPDFGVINFQIDEAQNGNINENAWQISYKMVYLTNDTNTEKSIENNFDTIKAQLSTYFTEFNLYDITNPADNGKIRLDIKLVGKGKKEENIYYDATSIYTQSNIGIRYNIPEYISSIGKGNKVIDKSVTTDYAINAWTAAYGITDFNLKNKITNKNIPTNRQLNFETNSSLIAGFVDPDGKQSSIDNLNQYNGSKQVDVLNLSKLSEENYFSGAIDYSASYYNPYSLFKNGYALNTNDFKEDYIINANLIQFYNQLSQNDLQSYCNYNSIYVTYMQTGYGRSKEEYHCKGNGPSVLAIHQNNKKTYNYDGNLMNIAVGKPMSQCSAYNGLIRVNPKCYVDWNYRYINQISNNNDLNVYRWDNDRLFLNTNRTNPKKINGAMMFWALGSEATCPSFRGIGDGNPLCNYDGTKDQSNFTIQYTADGEWLFEKLIYTKEKTIDPKSDHMMYFIYVDNFNNSTDKSLKYLQSIQDNLKKFSNNNIYINFILAFATLRKSNSKEENSLYDLRKPNTDGTIWGSTQANAYKVVANDNQFYSLDTLNKSSQTLELTDGFMGLYKEYLDSATLGSMELKYITAADRKNNNYGYLLYSFGGANVNIGLITEQIDAMALGKMLALVCFKYNFDGIDLDLESINKVPSQINWIGALQFSIKSTFINIENDFIKNNAATFNYPSQFKFILTDAGQPLYYDTEYFGNTPDYQIDELQGTTENNDNPCLALDYAWATTSPCYCYIKAQDNCKLDGDKCQKPNCATNNVI